MDRTLMATKRTPRPRDPVQLGKLMVDIMTGQVPDAVDDGKDAGAAAMGRKGAAARAAGMTPERRAEIAKKAASKATVMNNRLGLRFP
jgi:hypothetical protein